MSSNPDVSLAIYLDKRKVAKGQKCPVKLRVTYNRDSRFYAIKGHKYSEAEFKKIYSPKAPKSLKPIRLKLDEEISKAQEIIDTMLNGFTFDEFKLLYKGRKSNASKPQTVQDYFSLKISISKYSTGKIYSAILNSLLEFDSKISFRKISPTYLMKYHNWLLENEKTYTTIGVYMRHFKHIVNKAVEHGTMKVSPFGAQKGLYQIPTSKPSHRALTKEQISILYKYTSSSSQENYYLQYFLFSYFCSGMNMIDIAKLKYGDIEGHYFTFVRTKTKDTSKNVPTARIFMSTPVMEIIQKIGNTDTSPENYIFPVINKKMSDIEAYKAVKQHVKQTNKYIKRIAKKLDIEENITTYWARHTFSTVSLLEGAPLEYISEQLTHQNITTTTAYIDSFKDDHRKEYTQKLLTDL